MANTKLATFGRPADGQYISVARLSDNVTIPTSVGAELTGFSDAGLVTEDGITQTLDLGKDDPLRDWNLLPQISPEGSPTSQIEIPLMSQTAVALGLVYGKDNVSGTDAAGLSYSFDGTTDTYVIVIDELWNATNGNPTRRHRLVYPNAVPREISDVEHTKTGAVIYDITFDALADENNKLFYGYTDGAAGNTTGTTGSEG